MNAARLIITALSLTALVGCSQQILYREGATTAQIDRARTDCTLEAQREAPVRTQTQILPGRWIPPRQTCDATGACVTTPGYQSFPEFVTVDANAGTRDLLVRQCLARRGIDPVTLPLCDAAAKSRATPGITRVLPPLTEASCVIPRGSGAYQIVTP